MDVNWFKNHTAYTIAKYGMSMCVLGMAEEFKGKVAVNALWPLTTIATAAVNMLGGDPMMKSSRKPEIMSDSAWFILTRKATECSGNFFIDEDVIRSEGISDLDKYAYEPGQKLTPDFFVPEEKLKLLENKEDNSFLKINGTTHDESISNYMSVLQNKIATNENLKRLAVCVQYDLKKNPTDNAQIFTLDLKYGNGAIHKGKVCDFKVEGF